VQLNELNGDEAKTLVAQGCICVAEGANMPICLMQLLCFKKQNYYSLQESIKCRRVATSGLEMSQNSLRLNWTSEEVDGKLKVLC
jgi:glutamate dehydrogenase (NADP+)